MVKTYSTFDGNKILCTLLVIFLHKMPHDCLADQLLAKSSNSGLSSPVVRQRDMCERGIKKRLAIVPAFSILKIYAFNGYQINPCNVAQLSSVIAFFD